MDSLLLSGLVLYWLSVFSSLCSRALSLYLFAVVDCLPELFGGNCLLRERAGIRVCVIFGVESLVGVFGLFCRIVGSVGWGRFDCLPSGLIGVCKL